MAEARAIPVRVVRVTERRRWAGIPALAAVALTYFHHEAGSSDAEGWWLQGAFAFWCLATVLTWVPRPRTSTVHIESGAVRLGGEVLLDGIIDASVAQGARGFSILLSRDGEPFFLEVDTEAEARALLGALDIPWPGVASIEVVARNDNLRLLQRLIAGVGIVTLLGNALVTLLDRQLGHEISRVLGPLAVFCTVASTTFFVLDPKLRRRFVLGENARATKGTADSKGIVDVHVRAHLRQRVGAGERAEEAPPSNATGHARTLDKGAETTRAWLARIDALGAGGEVGYRGAAPTVEELWQIVEDERAPERARLAAIRLLGQRGGETEKEKIRRRVDDDALAPRVRVVLEEESVETAADELDALGPVFRAKERA